MDRKELLETYKAKTNRYNIPGYTDEDIEKIYGKDSSNCIIICPVCGNKMFSDDYCNECGYSEHILPCSDDLIKQLKEDYHKQKESQNDYVWFVDKVQHYKWRT